MKHDPQRVLEILLDELAQALRLSPEQIGRCRQQAAAALRPRRAALFLATGESPLSDAAIEAVRTLTALGVAATVLRSHSFAQVWSSEVTRARLGPIALLDDLSAEEIAGLPEQFPLLCVPALSDNTAIKSVLGLRDATPPRVLRAFLERGRPVIVAGAPPQRVTLSEDSAVYWGLPLVVRQWLAESYRTLEQWGAEFVEAERLAEVIRRRLFVETGAPPTAPFSGAPVASAPHVSSSTGRVFITADDVRAARNRSERQMQIPSHATVTDEAREAAGRWGILLIE